MDTIINNTARIAWLIGTQPPAAIAELRGSPAYPDIRGMVSFYQTPLGVVLTTEVGGLPYKVGSCNGSIFAFHIHDGGSCNGDATDPFANSGKHYNPNNCLHPQHAGDLPPLFGNDGYAWSSVLTNRFSVAEIINKTVIIHSKPDDFTTQPSGNAGAKIACGVIRGDISLNISK